MKRIVKYTSVSPYHTDITHTYIGSSMREIEDIQYETEEFMAGEEYGGLTSIYKSEVIYEGE